jgi:hypothetical protein
MVNVVQFLTEPEPQKHPKVSFRMELIMEQMINQMNQLNIHLLQPRISKNINVEKDLSGDGTLFKKMSKLANLVY